MLKAVDFDAIITKYVTWGWIGAGVPYGLQNRYEELIPSRVGSIPTHSRPLSLHGSE